MEKHPQRKLAVILHADVAGSTALVQLDETLAHQRIQGVFHRFSETITAYGGIAHELRGDALVAEFNRASDAVTAALAFQLTNTEFNATLDGDIRPQIRIGISLGEVVIADQTITGAGVVLAQRLEQLAESGGVCIQGAAYETVPQRLPFVYESLGNQQVKGFVEPVLAYAAVLRHGHRIPSPEPNAATAEALPERLNRWWFALGAMMLLIIVAGTLAWWQSWVPKQAPASVARIALPLPDKPSIAVLPFTNMSDDPKQEYFADGMTEDLITDLSKLTGLFVIARNSVFTYKGKSVQVRQVAEDLGVRYVLEGSVRRAGGQVRINAQLIDATTGGHLWAERYDGSLADVFAIQDAVTRKITAALAIQLTDEEETRQGRQETDNPDAYDAFLEGWARYRLGTPDDLAKAVAYFRDAIRLDSGYSRAHAALAAVYWEAWSNGWTKSLNTSSFRAMQQLTKHMQYASKTPTPLTHSIASKLLGAERKYEESVAEAKRAIALDGNDSASKAALASALILADRPAEGVAVIQQAMRLDPYYPPGYLVILGQAQYGMEQYKDAASTLERAVKRAPQSEWAWIYLAAAYGQLGRIDERQSAIFSFNDVRVEAGLSALTASHLEHWGFGGDVNRKRLLAGLGNPNSRWASLVTRCTWCASGYEVTGAQTIDTAAAKKLHEQGILFIDMRNDQGWNEGHIPGAVHIKSGDLSRRALAVYAQKQQGVVFYCYGKDCQLSPNGAAQAITWGYQNVYYFANGIKGWKAANYPVVKGKGT